MAPEDLLETDLDTALQQLGRVLTTFVVCPRCGERVGHMARTSQGAVCQNCKKEENGRE